MIILKDDAGFAEVFVNDFTWYFVRFVCNLIADYYLEK